MTPSDDLQRLVERIDLRMTCGAFPEQYDAHLDGQHVGYLRLRHGWFRVDYPDCGGETVFEASPRGDGFFFDEERDGFLDKAKHALAARITQEQSNDPSSNG